MVLHTNFRDYYDSAIGFGVDKKVHFNRFTKETEIILKTQNNWPVHSQSGLIGFCGKTHPLIKLHKFDKRVLCDLETARPKIIEVYYSYSFEAYEEKETEWDDLSWDFHGYWDRSRKMKLKQYFSEWSFENDTLFRKLGVPIWVKNFGWTAKQTGIVNPRLKDYQFDRVKDSTTAFQEISMYISNILVEQKEVAVVEDKYRIQQHGFDVKSSFRNRKDGN
jgi:hypothetical protein